MNFGNIISQFSAPAIFTLLATLLFVIFALKVYPMIGLMDRPNKYGLNRKPIPYYGGLAIFLPFLIAVLIFVPITKELLGFLIASSGIVLLGFMDDMFDLSPVIRLIVQFFCALILVIFGIGIYSFNLPFIGMIDLSNPLYGGLFTIFWVMLILNTMNLVDGVSGLSSGVTAIAGFTLFLLSIHPGIHENPESQVGLATLSLIIGTAAFVFLFFDFPKPKILMGDTGSTFLGFTLATLSIFSGGKVATAFLVLGIPILDMVWVILRRIFSGQKFWKGDLNHLHHRLLRIGLSDRMVVFSYLAVTAFLGVTATLLVSSLQKFYMLLGLILFMVLLALVILLSPKKK